MKVVKPTMRILSKTARWVSPFLTGAVFISILCCAHPKPANAQAGREMYYIGTQPVLLYKLINWWYDCPRKEAEYPCGSRIKYIGMGNTRVKYCEETQVLTLSVAGGIAGMLSMLTSCGRCTGPSRLACTGLNPRYFGNATAVEITGDSPVEVVFRNMTPDHHWQVRDIERSVGFELEGMVCGLLDGRIALHYGADFIKACPNLLLESDGYVPPSLRIIHSTTREVLATYTAVQPSGAAFIQKD